MQSRHSLEYKPFSDSRIFQPKPTDNFCLPFCLKGMNLFRLLHSKEEKHIFLSLNHFWQGTTLLTSIRSSFLLLLGNGGRVIMCICLCVIPELFMSKFLSVSVFVFAFFFGLLPRPLCFRILFPFLSILSSCTS